MSSNINLCVIEGRLEKDMPAPAKKRGKDFCAFTLLNNRYYFQGNTLCDDVNVFQITASGPLAVRCVGLKKGTPMLVSGEFKSKGKEILIKAANIKVIGAKR